MPILALTTEGWVLFASLSVILIIVATLFSRLLLHLLNMHREERVEQNEANRRVISSLESAIRDASGTTNIFNASDQKNQIGEDNTQN